MGFSLLAFSYIVRLNWVKVSGQGHDPDFDLCFLLPYLSSYCIEWHGVFTFSIFLHCSFKLGQGQWSRSWPRFWPLLFITISQLLLHRMTWGFHFILYSIYLFMWNYMLCQTVSYSVYACVCVCVCNFVLIPIKKVSHNLFQIGELCCSQTALV